ncbi:unnamed protein product [Arabidopsis thaliana]|uniref:(thale cress) hypothetical protein n=1 Tax=Arabidopsis thaliana TaxID=3702 RepID=A0A7G2ERN9_ARATH|nr:unnamed protein product [Arabidopsis thaliana]
MFQSLLLAFSDSSVPLSSASRREVARVYELGQILGYMMQRLFLVLAWPNNNLFCWGSSSLIFFMGSIDNWASVSFYLVCPNFSNFPLSLLSPHLLHQDIVLPQSPFPSYQDKEMYIPPTQK